MAIAAITHTKSMLLRTFWLASLSLVVLHCKAFFTVDQSFLERRTVNSVSTTIPLLAIKSSYDGPIDDIAVFYSPNVPLNSIERTPKDRSGDDDSSNEYSFFDEAVILVRAGSGGPGANTYKKGVGNQNGPPDGGNGGKGGNVIFRLDRSLNTLAGLSQAWKPNTFGGSGAVPLRKLSPKYFRAENGHSGQRQLRSGGNGKDVVVRLPPGTLIQEKIENKNGGFDYIDAGEINDATPEIIVARGGEGGEGTAVLKSGRGVKRTRVSEQGGERKTMKLTLKIVADVALVGVPNAGKSTFLAAITRSVSVNV
jgi:GTP1/OBG/50S ribosome-binding GTPase